MGKRPFILYLFTEINQTGKAQSINAVRRKRILENLGYTVELFPHRTNAVISDILSLLQKLPRTDYLYIRIDGSSILDKFTLLKILKPRMQVVWEIHGFPEENIFYSTVRNRLWIVKHRVKRMILSLFVSAYVFISDSLRIYAYRKISSKKRQVVIPNFISVPTVKTKKGTVPIFSLLQTKSAFTVMWAGDASFRWNAVDLIEKVARRIYHLDPTVVFVLVGPEAWQAPTWYKNILRIHSLPQTIVIRLLTRADVCLALYHKAPYTPLYCYPLKILDYMALKKPVIATKEGEIKKIITHGYNGLLTTNSVSDIVSKILALKSNAKRAKSLGRHALQTVRDHHGDQVAKRSYLAIFSK